MEWSDLRVLLAVSEAGSATAAARTLRVDKATVTRRISALERDLGIRLMVRRARGWIPTRAGERVAVAARTMDGEARSMLSDLAGRHGAPRTLASITAPHWFCRRILLPALGELLEKAPWLDVSVAAGSRVLNLAQREADVALRNRRPDEGNFIVRRAGELGSAIYGSRRYLRAHGTPDTPRLEGHALVGYPDRMTYVPDLQWIDSLVGSASSVVRADDAESLLEAVRAGLGLGVLPCVLADDPALVRIGAVHREAIWLVSPIELASTRGVRLTLRFVADLFRRHEIALWGG